MKKFVIGDIHGNFKGLKQVLNDSKFNYNDDILISLGDVVDRLPDSYECVEELLKIKNLIIINSNHDDSFKTWLNTKQHSFNWSGSIDTLKSYSKNILKRNNTVNEKLSGVSYELNVEEIPKKHYNFFNNRKNYYIDEENNLFVHAGFNKDFLIDDIIHNNDETLLWDRTFWNNAIGSYLSKKVGKKNGHNIDYLSKNNFNEIYIGHTPTIKYGTNLPMKVFNIYNLDTGSPYKNGKLTLMNIKTKEIYQSDLKQNLYN